MLVESIGRIGGPRKSFDWRIIEYLDWIAKKHNLETPKFLGSIMRAWVNGVSKCEKLRIQCIINAEDYPHFRITKAKRLVAQTKVNMKLLKDAIDRKAKI